MFVGTVVAAMRRRAGRSLAQRQFPRLAERLGLRFEAPRYDGWVGQLKGAFEGHDVLVQPDERARIVVLLRQPLQIDLRTFQHWKRAPEGKSAFSFKERKLNAWLPNRWCADGLEGVLGDNGALAAALDALRVHPHVKQLVLDEERLEFTLDYGSPPYIPAGDVQALLQSGARIVGEVEACFGV